MYKITQIFGERPEAYKKFGVAGHTGIDFATPKNTPIFAPFDGYVTTGYDKTGYGKYIKLRSIDGLKEVIFAHLNDFNIFKGLVKSGEQLGLTGNTGNSTGNHLHLELRNKNVKNAYGGAIDIQKEEPNLLINIFKKGFNILSGKEKLTDINKDIKDSIDNKIKIFKNNNQYYDSFFYKLPIKERLKLVDTIKRSNDVQYTYNQKGISPYNPVYYLTNLGNYNQDIAQAENPQSTQYPQPPEGTYLPPHSTQVKY